ncbi:hypothetical protein EJD97_001867 [Solanum chilense]|uniref:Uncharacterized protein n=1 Tax=Solanum chilense TaxID=4083 RepID=A0A6N2BYW5_SOLCI|nr:hypothetical protein EJD97_001867 [Solanum chilense]
MTTRREAAKVVEEDIANGSVTPPPPQGKQAPPNEQVLLESRGTMIKKNNRDAERARPYEGGASKGNVKIQDKAKIMKRFLNKGSYNSPKVNKDRVSNPNPYGGKGVGGCTKCGKRHLGKCLVGVDGFYGCGEVVTW